MADASVAKESASVVIRGRFNPAIFSPRWFEDEQLVGEVEHNNPEIEIISPSISIFKMAWASVHVSDDAFQVRTDDPDEFERVRDLATGVLRVLRHTPIMAIGLNREFHVRVADLDALDRIGDKLTPKDVWEPSLRFAGLRSVTMLGSRVDLYGGQLSIQVEPSLHIPTAGVFIAHNDHYDLTMRNEVAADRRSAYNGVADGGSGVTMTSEKVPLAIEVLASKWSDSMISAERVMSTVERLSRP